jgi:hypothetical protein
VLEARHIAEADDGVMTTLESQMSTAMQAARSDVAAIGSLPGQRGRTPLNEATAALDQFAGVHQQIIQLSRRNTNVKSTALALGRKRTLSAGCEDIVTQLAEALSKHEFRATR